MRRTLRNTLLLSPLLLLLLCAGGLVINSFGCHYDLKMSANGVNYHGICRWGKMTVIQEELASGEVWRVTGFQLTFLNQLIYLIDSRTQLHASGKKDSYLNEYNQLQSEYALVNYAWVPLTENKIALFQRDPVHDVVIAQRDGWFDLYRWWFSPTPILAPPTRDPSR
ncbi:hypothetical protein [Aeromonas encheleia]